MEGDGDRIRRLRAAVEPLPERPRQLDDPVTGERRSAVLVLADPATDGVPILFIRRSRVVSSHRGQIAFPGGRVEPGDEDVAATALREAHEEVGVDAHAVRVIGVLPPLTTATSGRWLDPVVALRTGELSMRGDGYEVAEHFWVPLAELERAPVTRRRIPAWVEERHVTFIEVGGRVIWGATAAIVAGLLDRIR